MIWVGLVLGEVFSSWIVFLSEERENATKVSTSRYIYENITKGPEAPHNSTNPMGSLVLNSHTLYQICYKIYVPEEEACLAPKRIALYSVSRNEVLQQLQFGVAQEYANFPDKLLKIYT